MFTLLLSPHRTQETLTGRTPAREALQGRGADKIYEPGLELKGTFHLRLGVGQTWFNPPIPPASSHTCEMGAASSLLLGLWEGGTHTLLPGAGPL